MHPRLGLGKTAAPLMSGKLPISSSLLWFKGKKMKQSNTGNTDDKRWLGALLVGEREFHASNSPFYRAYSSGWQR